MDKLEHQEQITKKQHDILYRSLKGNKDAFKLCLDIFHISQLWDDLVDGDKPVNPLDINKVFYKCLVEIPSNPFYIQHRATITPALSVFAHDWMDANLLELSTEHHRNIAFVLRDSVASLALVCAEIIGGYEWCRRFSPLLRDVTFDETLEEYKQELKIHEHESKGRSGERVSTSQSGNGITGLGALDSALQAIRGQANREDDGTAR